MECDGGDMKVAVIGNRDMLALFRMAGVTECYDKEEKFDEIVKRDDIGILVVSGEFCKKLRNKIVYHRLVKNLPIIVELPEKEEEWEDTIKRLIVRAVGVEVE